MNAPVLVLGAGLTGLSASVGLRRAGVPHRVLERAPHVGGHAVTVEEAGYRFDRTGHLLHLRDDALRDEIVSWLGPHGAVDIARKSVVFSHGVTTRYPFQANVHGLPPEVAYECVAGFVRARERAIKHPDAPPPADFEEYVLRHFGEGIARHFMVPYNQKLWGVHPSAITAAWCDRFVPIPSLDDVLRGAFGQRGAELGYNQRFLYPRRGIGALVDALAERAGVVETGRAPEAIDLAAREVVVGGERVPFGALVSTIPLDVLVRLLLDAPAVVRAAGERLRVAPLVYLDVALNTPAGVPWHWCYVPDPDVPFYRVGVYSNFSASMAPAGKASLYVELADRAEPDLATLLPRVAEELVRMQVIRAPEAIRFARVRRLEHAYVLFDHHHAEAVATIEAHLAAHGVLSTGRYGRWTYASMEDALLDGRAAATWAGARLAGGAVPTGAPA